MKNIKLIVKLLLLLFVISCTENKTTDINATTYYSVPNLSKKVRHTRVTKVDLERVIVNTDIESSYQGHFWVHNDSLYFSDTEFAYVFNFNEKGSVLGKYIGKGKGPNEILGIGSTTATDQGCFFFHGGSNGLYSYDKHWKKKKGGKVDWNFKRTYKEVLKNPEPTLPESYEFDSGYENIIKPWDENHVSIAITAAHPKFNGWIDSSLYYNYSRILAIVNIETGKIDEFVGRRSPFYLSRLNLPIFDHFNYESIKNTVYVDFWADKDIYVLDKKTGLSIGKFGVQGRNMKVDYETTKNYEESMEKHYKHREKYGYYRYLKFDNKTNTLYRSYTKGENSTTDGLQIYQNYNLIGDLDIPKGFEILGTIRGETIGAIRNYEREDFEVFKVKFNDEI